MRYIIDIESTNLLQNGLDYTSMPYQLKSEYKVWCVVVRNIDTNEVLSLVKEEITRKNLSSILEDCTEIIGHNIVAFDLPVLMLYGALDYSVGYPDQSSTLFGKPVTITDTLLWSKLLNADRLGGHSLDAWGKRLGNTKVHFKEWDRFSQEMLDYCIQDTSVNHSVLTELIKEQGQNAWKRPYSMEVKLTDLTLRQELFGFDFNVELAHKNVAELSGFMQGIAKTVDPLLPKKRMTQGNASFYQLPKIRFKKNGEVSSNLTKFCEKLGAVLSEDHRSILYDNKTFPITTEVPLKSEEDADIEDIDVVKSYLLSLGWIPSEVKERDIVKKTDKSIRDYDGIIEAIDRYVKQTENSVFRELRLDFLGVRMENLRAFLIKKINGTKPIYLPTTPRLTVGIEKEICPNLIALGEKADFVKDVVHYYTYRHRKNSISGGALDEDGEPMTGFLSAVREDGRVPTPADTLGANTGRYRHKIVCNVPRVTSLYGEKMRSLFGSGKGLWQLGYDFASLEARVMGHYVLPYTDGVNLADALVAEKPNDIHSINAGKLGIDRSSAKSFSYACLPLQTKVLTPSGWKTHDQLQEGDPVFSFNAEKDVVEIDSIQMVHYFKDKEVFRFKNKRDSFECTSEHRWYGKRRSKTRSGSKDIYGYFKAEEFTQEHNIILTAPYVGGNSDVSEDQAKLMGYILSDGAYRWSAASERTSCSGGNKKYVRLQLSQSLNKFHKEIEDLLVKLQMKYHKAANKKENGNTCFNWVISSPDSRRFLDAVVKCRKDKHEVNWVQWVCDLPRKSLEAFYEGFYNGDGNITRTDQVISQNVGTIHEAVVTASQLLGNGRVTLNKHSGTNAVCEGIRVQKKRHITMQEQVKISLGIKDTFCLTTSNSSFIIWQDSFIGITGNCIYGAQPKKLSKMIGVTEGEGSRLFSAYWDAVPALKELKERVEQRWEASGKKNIPGIDGRLLSTRSKHSLINVLFQSGGAIAAKWSAVRLAQAMEDEGILGDPFKHSKKDVKVWWLIHMHDEQQMACHPSLLKIKSFESEEEAKEFVKLNPGCSAIGHGSKGAYVGLKTLPVDCIEKGIKQACNELKLRVDLGFEYIPGANWGQCH